MPTFQPREQHAFGRRELLGRGAVGLAGLSSLSTLLAACGGGDSGSGGPELQLARADNQVTQPLFEDNQAIASGLDPEQGPLQLYNWNGYIWPKKLKEFGKEYGVDVKLSTFATMDEAIAKIASGAVEFDVFFPSPDRPRRLGPAEQLPPPKPPHPPHPPPT